MAVAVEAERRGGDEGLFGEFKGRAVLDFLDNVSTDTKPSKVFHPSLTRSH